MMPKYAASAKEMVRNPEFQAWLKQWDSNRWAVMYALYEAEGDTKIAERVLCTACQVDDLDQIDTTMGWRWFTRIAQKFHYRDVKRLERASAMPDEAVDTTKPRTKRPRK